MYKIICAIDFRLHDYRIIEDEIEKITEKQFINKCKEIVKEYHPVRFILLENSEQGIVAVYRNKKIVMNNIWKKRKKKK